MKHYASPMTFFLEHQLSSRCNATSQAEEEAEGSISSGLGMRQKGAFNLALCLQSEAAIRAGGLVRDLPSIQMYFHLLSRSISRLNRRLFSPGDHKAC